MSLFRDLRIDVLYTSLNGPDAADTWTYRAADRSTLFFVTLLVDRLRVRVGDSGPPVELELGELASPGAAVQVGAHHLHFQLLRAENGSVVGPLLVFENAAPLPCLPPARGLRRLFPARKAFLPVYVVRDIEDAASRKRMYREDLNLAEALLLGRVAPGGSDNDYLRAEP